MAHHYITRSWLLCQTRTAATFIVLTAKDCIHLPFPSLGLIPICISSLTLDLSPSHGLPDGLDCSLMPCVVLKLNQRSKGGCLRATASPSGWQGQFQFASLFPSLFSVIGCHSHQDLLKPHLHLNNIVVIPWLWSRCSCCFVTFWGSQATEEKLAECSMPNVLKWIQTHLSSGSIKAAHSHCLFQLTSVTWSLFFCYSHYPVNQAVHLNLP